MKKITILIFVFALLCASANAQSILERLGNRARNAVENNIGNKVEKGINDILDGKAGKNNNGNNQNEEDAFEQDRYCQRRGRSRGR